MKLYLSIIFFCFFTISIFSQTKKNLPINDSKLAFEVNGFVGKIFKHTSKFIPIPTELTYGFEVSASYKTFGNKNWHYALNYPEVGISYIQTHFGDKAIFGSAYSIMPHVKFYMTRNKIVDFYSRLGAGLSYLPKVYDPVTNPTNNVIGSKINSIVQFKIGLDFHITKEVNLSMAGAFTHFSNAGSQAPNLGINVPMGSLGLVYRPKQFVQEYDNKKLLKKGFVKKNEYQFKFALGMKDKNPRGPKFPVYSLALQYGRFIGPANKIVAGTIVTFDQYEYDYMKIEEQFEDKDQTLMAIDWTMYVGYEMMVGNVGLSFLIGTYLIDNAYKTVPIFAKPGITYYFVEFGKQKHKPFVGVNLKTHYFEAQYVEIHTGIAF